MFTVIKLEKLGCKRRFSRFVLRYGLLRRRLFWSVVGVGMICRGYLIVIWGRGYIWIILKFYNGFKFRGEMAKLDGVTEGDRWRGKGM